MYIINYHIFAQHYFYITREVQSQMSHYFPFSSLRLHQSIDFVV